MSIDLILVKCLSSKVSAIRISNGYCIKLKSFLVLTWSLKVDVVFVYVQFALVVVVNLAFMDAQQLTCFFF